MSDSVVVSIRSDNRVVPVCEDTEVLKKIHEYENDIYEMEMERLSEMRMGA
jgi:hypothetical protein